MYLGSAVDGCDLQWCAIVAFYDDGWLVEMMWAGFRI